MPYPNHDFVWRCFIWTGEEVLYHWITIKSPWNPIKLPWNQHYQHLSTLNHPNISKYFHIFPYIYWLMNQPSYQPDFPPSLSMEKRRSILSGTKAIFSAMPPTVPSAMPPLPQLGGYQAERSGNPMDIHGREAVVSLEMVDLSYRSVSLRVNDVSHQRFVF